MIQLITSRVLHGGLSSDAISGFDAQSGLDAQPSSNLPLKLPTLVHLFTAYQNTELLLPVTCYKLPKCRTTFASYTLQTSAPIRNLYS